AQIRGHVIGQTMGRVQYSCFSSDAKLVALCIEREVHILPTKLKEKSTGPLAVLEGHTSYVNAAQFCPHYSSTLVSVSDDRTFKIWDVVGCELIYQSSIISSSPFISISMHPRLEQFALGSSDGVVRVYDTTEGNGFRCLNTIDAEKLISKHRYNKLQAATEAATGPVTVSSRPAWQRGNNGSVGPNPILQQEDSEAGCAILGLHFTYTADKKEEEDNPHVPSFLKPETTTLKDIFNTPPILMIGTTGALLQLNAKSLEVISIIDSTDELLNHNAFDDEGDTLGLAGSYTFGQGFDVSQTFCAVGNLFANGFNILRLPHSYNAGGKISSSGVTDEHQLDNSDILDMGRVADGLDCFTLETRSENQEITVLSSVPICANSPLKAELVPKTKHAPTSAKKSQKGFLKKSTIGGDQALTFKSSIKSSGYTEKPRSSMFSPQTRTKPQKKPDLGKISKGMERKEYPMNCEPPIELVSKIDIAERPTPVNSITFLGDGSCVTCGLANESAQVLRLPLSSGKGTTFTGHNGAVNSVFWSHDNKYLLTSSEDNSAALWCQNQTDPIMTFTQVKNNFRVDKEGDNKLDKDNPIFSKAIKHAQFYFVDKFIILVCSNTFYMYKYNLDTSKSDVKRYLTKSHYKIVKSFHLSGSQQITAFSAVNQFHSYISLCAGSNRALEVFDLNVAKSVQTIEDIHSRPAHVICQNQGSAYASHPSSSYDLFLTAAVSDSIKLWDLRMNRCVQRYEGHQNRVYPCGLAISPCSRYIATGSEDKADLHPRHAITFSEFDPLMQPLTIRPA
ncbi:unnamed protein product, partial [Owenia fusiformis]